MPRSEAQRRAEKKYQRTLTQIAFKLPASLYGDVIDYWKSQENQRQHFIEVTKELIEREKRTQ